MHSVTYSRLAFRTESPAFVPGLPVPETRLLHAVLGLATESGELVDSLKRFLFYGKPLDLVNVVEEFGDLLWYVAIGLDAAGSSIDEAMDLNIAKLRARYPEKFTCEAALSRDLAGERAALEGGVE